MKTRKQLEVKKEKLKKVKPKKEKLKKEKVRKPKKERIKKERPAKQMERKPQPKKTGNSRKAAKDKGMGLRGIQVKLIGAFMIPVILFVIIGFMIYSKCSTTLNSTYEASANTSVGTLEEYLGLGFENIELMATRLSINSTITSYYTGSEVKSESMLMDAKVALSNESTADKFIDHIIVCAKSGTACSEKGAIRGDVYNAFVESEEGKNVESEIGMGSMWISSHPAIDEVTGYDSDEYALSLVTVLKNNSNKSVGYIIIDVKTSFIQDILDNAQISDNSIKGFVLEDGSQVLSGDSDIKFTDTDFYQEALAGENLQGSKEVSYEGADYLFTYSRIEGTNMLVCAMVPQKEIMAGAQAILRYTLIAVAICAVIAIVVGSVLASGISKAIRKVNRVLKKTSDGDLTGQISMKRKDEFNVLSSSITNMIGSMKDLILKMTNVSGHVSDSAVQVGTNSEVLLEVTKDITEAVDYINSGISQQAQDTESCLEQMNGLAERINVVHENTDEISEIAQEAQGAIENGMVIVANLGEKVQGTTEVTETIIREIRELNKESIAINSIIGTINEIAEQTNLLSLNASIEAARAGEAGRGFAVVSEEIRKLAEQSGNAGNQIGEIINHIQERLAATIETAGLAGESVAFQTEALNNTVDVFKNISQQVSKLAEDVEKITQSVGGIEQAKEDTMNAIESISTTSNQTESASEELARSTEKQLQAVEVLNDAVKRLQMDAEDLDTSVSIFKVQ
ncbi:MULTISPECIES: methyl-accepting chemotaxis protein [unclassified Roseburia]|uniref:methyl-accepting chemotaxis protein n=1 Tax=unclassified Roseburia TaxID=2637578 RepID=UPI000E518746|nr:MULTISPECIES: methyl-accepting chemotaxis protein [unclassified Roseburia]RHQ40991.1 methyl-accepting chemotaxis protein [Roseburia sp. AF25-25LB]RHQ41572.1 methyl-accepting chemotaxis protein [Roseburia sp. AF25-18LB]RHQ47524.1 methyl-accepting chemotaxis protein [Roseburia sp. AF25-15LB]RHQ47714.1 methyl-accepting chemotaxis protein [Roseburia sp. AF25-13LB]RHS26594.1 methyl-accepting chemotaxis protein [Roseburia sp. AF12-17LB]